MGNWGVAFLGHQGHDALTESRFPFCPVSTKEKTYPEDITDEGPDFYPFGWRSNRRRLNGAISYLYVHPDLTQRVR